MTSKYPAWAAALALLLGSCIAPGGAAAPPSASASPAPSAATPPPLAVVPATPATIASPATVPTASAPPGLERTVAAIVGAKRRWYLVPDGLQTPDGPSFTSAVILAQFESDPTAGAPFARLRATGREYPLVGPTTGPTSFQAAIPLEGLAPQRYVIDVLEHLTGGREAVVGTAEFMLSAPEYAVWTLDFEGDESADPELANTAAIADGLRVPMVVMWNPRVWSTAEVRPERAAAMLAWTKGRAAKGDEVALHLHGWLDWIRAAGVAPRATPTWAGRRDGYDVPLSAYPEDEMRMLLEAALRQMAEHGLPRPTSFRAGGHFASAPTLRALAATGFSVDCSAVPAGSFGALRLPWTLPRDAQPYFPSGDDPSKPGDLPLLESPTIGGNTYGHTATSIEAIVRTDLGILAPAGEVARERRALNIVSHPGTIVPAERAAIERLFGALAPLRYDRDAGPLRFVTLQQLARAYAP